MRALRWSLFLWLLMSACVHARTPAPPHGPPVATAWSQWLPATKDGKTGYIDRTGRWVIVPQFDCAWRFPAGEDRARVAIGNRLGYIDPGGKVVIAPHFEVADSFHEGQATFTELEPDLKRGHGFVRAYGFVDRDGRIVTRAHVNSLGDLMRGLALFTVDAGSGYVDRDGGVVIPPHFRRAQPFGEDGLAPACEDKCGYIDARGAWAIAPVYDQVQPFDHGLAVVGDGPGRAQWGMIDRAGTIMVPLVFDHIGRFSGGLAPAAEGGAFLARREAYARGHVPAQHSPAMGQIDQHGRFVESLTENDRFMPTGEFSEGLVAAIFKGESGMAWGYVDRNGAVIIEPQFVQAGAFHDGRAHATAVPETREHDPLSSNRAPLVCGYIDRTGKWIVPPRYRWCQDFRDSIAEAMTGEPPGDAGCPTVGAPRIEYIDPSGQVLGKLECTVGC